MIDVPHLESLISAAKPRHPELVKRDVTTALNQFRDLYPGTEHHVYNDGRQLLSVTLNGTIPINYKSNVYNIPVCLYISETHPHSPPICYVRPTAGMVIRQGPSVDMSGRIYLPYLHQWKYPKCDLSGLISVMIITFNESCPVFSRSSGSATNLAGVAPNPYPGSAPFSGYGFAPQPPVPSQSCPPSMSGGPAQYQPYPGPTTTTGAQQRGWYSSTPYPASGGFTPTNPPYPAGSAGGGGPAMPQPAPPIGVTGRSETYGTIQPEHIRSSLQSAVQDKLRARLREAIGMAQAELESIQKTREDLNLGEQRIRSILGKMQSEESELQAAATVYQDSIDEMQKLLSTVDQGEDLKIDDAMDTTTPLYRQLLNCYVEDNAIEDCIYYLSQALKNNKLDVDLFLKNVRTLSREQFRLRALMIKCRQVAGLSAR